MTSPFTISFLFCLSLHLLVKTWPGQLKPLSLYKSVSITWSKTFGSILKILRKCYNWPTLDWLLQFKPILCSATSWLCGWKREVAGEIQIPASESRKKRPVFKHRSHFKTRWSDWLPVPSSWVISELSLVTPAALLHIGGIEMTCLGDVGELDKVSL